MITDEDNLQTEVITDDFDTEINLLVTIV